MIPSSRISCWAILIAVTGCTGPPEQKELASYLVSEAALPIGCGGANIRVFREDVGDFQQDWSDIYQVTADEACFAVWRDKLARSADWECNAGTVECTRGPDGARRDSNAERYREEWATVRFLAANLAQVELLKI